MNDANPLSHRQPPDRRVLPALTCDQVRLVDEIAINTYGMPSIVLMENAGRGAAELIHQQSSEGKIIILCGIGNNGGDGYVIGRHLQALDREVEIVSLSNQERLSAEARINFQIAQKAKIPITFSETTQAIDAKLRDAQIIVDAMLGTGAKGSPRGIYEQAIFLANEKTATKYAIDIPTGLDCDSGLANRATFQADHTLTFVAEKVGFKKNNAKEILGVVHVLDIGVPRKLLDDLLIG